MPEIKGSIRIKNNLYLKSTINLIFGYFSTMRSGQNYYWVSFLYLFSRTNLQLILDSYFEIALKQWEGDFFCQIEEEEAYFFFSVIIIISCCLLNFLGVSLSRRHLLHIFFSYIKPHFQTHFTLVNPQFVNFFHKNLSSCQGQK